MRNEYLIATIGVDTAENAPLRDWDRATGVQVMNTVRQVTSRICRKVGERRVGFPRSCAAPAWRLPWWRSSILRCYIRMDPPHTQVELPLRDIQRLSVMISKKQFKCQYSIWLSFLKKTANVSDVIIVISASI